MAFNIHNVNRRNELSLIEILFNKPRAPKNEAAKKPNSLKRDTLVISSEAQSLSNTQEAKTASSNTRIDQSIDLQACIENAKTANQEAIAAAGDEIKANNFKAYTSEFDVYKAAVRDKYSRLVKEAKTHSNPEDYIYQKYHNYNSSWYASDLNDEERKIAYSNELNMLNYGRLSNYLGDSLLRGVTLGVTSFDVARKEFNRQMVNSQINNILYNVSNMLDLDIRNLSERNGTYYTDSGEDIIALYNKSVDESKKIPYDFKAFEKESFAKLVRQISSRGWNNISDMILSINYNESGLIDKYQNYGFGATSREWLESMLKTSTYCVML